MRKHKTPPPQVPGIQRGDATPKFLRLRKVDEVTVMDWVNAQGDVVNPGPVWMKTTDGTMVRVHLHADGSFTIEQE